MRLAAFLLVLLALASPACKTLAQDEDFVSVYDAVTAYAAYSAAPDDATRMAVLADFVARGIGLEGVEPSPEALALASTLFAGRADANGAMIALAARFLQNGWDFDATRAEVDGK